MAPSRVDAMMKYRLILSLVLAEASVLLAMVIHSQSITHSPVKHTEEVDEGINYPALVRAITEVESKGNPRAVGRAGERGLMQIKESVWSEVTQRKFGKEIPFSRAFEPKLNQQVGRAYLEQIATRLETKRERLDGSLLALAIASYQCGPTRVETLGFSTQRLEPYTRGYVERVLRLHALYSTEANTFAMNTRFRR